MRAEDEIVKWLYDEESDELIKVKLIEQVKKQITESKAKDSNTNS